MAKSKIKPFCLLISKDTHKRIEEAIKENDGMTKCSWIREAIQEKFLKKQRETQ